MQAVAVEDDFETIYLQRHLDSGATFTEVRTRVLGTMKATTWFRESSAWSQVRDIIERIETATDFADLTEGIGDLRELAPNEGAEIS